MRELHLCAQVEPAAAGFWDLEQERTRGEIERLEPHVAEVHDLGQERVRPDVPVEDVADLVLLVGGLRLEPLDRRREERVDGHVITHPARPVRDERGDRRRLGHVDDLEGEQPVGHVVEGVRVRRDGDRRLVPGLESRGDVIGLVAEVEHERVGFLGLDAVES